MAAKKIHFVGVGGVGMGTLAVALAEAGHQISGSDGTLYDPMKSVLSTANVRLFEGYKEENCDQAQADVVIIGNVVRRENVEAQAWMRRGTPFLSFPQAVREFLIEDRVSVVCAGTHGKTTTTSWVSFLLSELGQNPSYLIGGVPRDLPRGCRVSEGQVFVGEGDEYDSAFFDKGPKFLHYNPSILVLANIEFDHADIYRDLAHVQSSFEKLVALLPGDGLCLARQEDPVVMEVVQGALCPVQTFGKSSGALWRLGKIEQDEAGYNFEVIYKGKSAGFFRTPLFGEHNLVNLLSGIAVAANLGNSMEKIRPIVERFNGARRRQEILLTSPVHLVDDFAHHPTEVTATLRAVRSRYSKGKLWAFFEPRSATSRRATHQAAYAKAFEPADEILVAQPIRQNELAEGERFSIDKLVEDLRAAGKTANGFQTPDEMVEHFKASVKPGDVVLVMSNGEFGKIQTKIRSVIEAL